MALVINTNVSSLNAQRNLSKTSGTLATSLQRLSSGLRINSAKDDAAGLAISQRMTSQIRGLNQAARNANDAVSLAQTAEGALQESGSILQRIRELSIQSANATNSASDRASLQSEVNQLLTELNNTASTTSFNGLKILDGTYSNQNFQIGSNANETVSVSIVGAAATDLAHYSISAGTNDNQQGTGSTAAAAATLPASNVIATQTLTVSGGSGSTTVAVTGGHSAFTVAANINAVEGTTGVKATASTTATLGTLSAAGTVTLTLSSGSSSATISATVTTTDVAALAREINGASGTTGITASASGGTLTLTQSSGRNIELANFNHSTGSATSVFKGSAEAAGVTLTQGANDSSVASGVVTLKSNASFSASSSIADTAGSIFDTAANTTTAATAAYVSAVNISTVSGAQSALDVIDSALQTIAGIRGSLGAIQNRLESTIANLSSTSENVSAARSRVLDADFGKEAAELTRGQILQQAGLSILAQANVSSQNVLALLQR